MSLAVERLLGSPVGRPAFLALIDRVRGCGVPLGSLAGPLDGLRRDLGLDPDVLPAEPAVPPPTEPPSVDVAQAPAAAPVPPPAVPGPARLVSPTPAPGDQKWTVLATDCAALVEELRRNRDALDEQAGELVDHVDLRLTEILERAGVDLIDDDAVFDARRHRAVNGPTRPEAGAAVAETVRTGLALGPKVLLKAQVRVADAAVAGTTEGSVR